MIVSKKAPGKKSITLVMNGWCVPFSGVEIISSRVRFGSEIAADYQNTRVCFGEFVADGCRENPKI